MNMHQRPLKLRIADFGLSDVIPDGEDAVSAAGRMTAWRYADPAVLSKKRFNRESDVWAAGVTMWEMTARSTPYVDVKHASDVIFACAKGLRLPKPAPGSLNLPVLMPAAVVDELYELMLSCWLPTDRPSFRDLAAKLGDMNKRGKWNLSGEESATPIKGTPRSKEASPRLPVALPSGSPRDRSQYARMLADRSTEGDGYGIASALEFPSGTKNSRSNTDSKTSSHTQDSRSPSSYSTTVREPGYQAAPLSTP